MDDPLPIADELMRQAVEVIDQAAAELASAAIRTHASDDLHLARALILRARRRLVREVRGARPVAA